MLSHDEFRQQKGDFEMKTKKASKTNTSRLIFFTIALTYNLIS